MVSREEAAPYVILEDEETPSYPDPQHHLRAADPRRRRRADLRRAGRHRGARRRARRSGSSGRRRPCRVRRASSRDGWTACTGDERGITLGLQSSPGLESVEDGGLGWWPTRSAPTSSPGRVTAATPTAPHLYPLPAGGDVDAMLNDLGLESTVEATDVPEDWLRLFPPVGTLGWTASASPTRRPGRTTRRPTRPSAPGRRLLGDGDEGSVLDPDRADAPDAVRVPGLPQTPVPVSNPAKPGSSSSDRGRLPGPPRPAPTYDDASWPAELLEPG